MSTDTYELNLKPLRDRYGQNIVLEWNAAERRYVLWRDDVDLLSWSEQEFIDQGYLQPALPVPVMAARGWWRRNKDAVGFVAALLLLVFVIVATQ